MLSQILNSLYTIYTLRLTSNYKASINSPREDKSKFVNTINVFLIYYPKRLLMKIKNTLFLAPFFLLTQMISNSPVSAKEVTGAVEIKYDTLSSLHLEGYPCQENELDCQAFTKTCLDDYGFMLNTTAHINYDIIVEKAYHYADLTYDNSMLPLSTMGFSKIYRFITPRMSADISEKYNVRSAFFTVDTEFKHFSSSFIFNLKTPDQKFQCLLSGSYTKP